MNTNRHLDWDKEEVANLITHGFGVIASAMGLGFLIYFAVQYGTIWEQVSFGLFGITMLMVFLASTIYHTIRNPKWKSLFQTIDQSAIFLLIAGSYAPFCLVSMRGPWGWSIFSLVWVLAISGIILKIYFRDTVVKPFLFLYVIMGWICVIATNKMLETIPDFSLIFIGVGGAFYMVGIIFFLWEKLPYNHAIWHIFVLGGCASHYVAVLDLIL
ncbi:MAG: hemolysin III family protein [Candidatus Marinimicrobia bacterium]|jgi:hemolysin III|nr:hemolysin III family protein [Candidatus Neomarinimicrobiota bacterium]MBT3501649.1 hemolysin III family protein [Candidatus Neomarinimicrobiota bacterium]MBT3839827.1 hemolysin III family protein [Candidatus Neomarinimicrobiota bacterium]MBT3998415.1 hemolysin III family protein [Candidatus Neomarinimicrobiota bacterium]MBT4282265.1 hemolysin III family protein [Candidatus Neomarinimicrobiota bacterium]